MCVIHVRQVQNHPLHIIRTVWQRRRLCDLILNSTKEWSAYGTLSATAVTAAIAVIGGWTWRAATSIRLAGSRKNYLEQNINGCEERLLNFFTIHYLHIKYNLGFRSRLRAQPAWLSDRVSVLWTTLYIIQSGVTCILETISQCIPAATLYANVLHSECGGHTAVISGMPPLQPSCAAHYMRFNNKSDKEILKRV